jgi:hypothetical protein
VKINAAVSGRSIIPSKGVTVRSGSLTGLKPAFAQASALRAAAGSVRVIQTLVVKSDPPVDFGAQRFAERIAEIIRLTDCL